MPERKRGFGLFVVAVHSAVSSSTAATSMFQLRRGTTSGLVRGYLGVEGSARSFRADFEQQGGK